MKKFFIKILSRLFNFFRLISTAPSHLRNVSRAKKIFYKTIPKIKLESKSDSEAAARTISYLKKIDPYVFEELILCAVEEHGGFVIRNRSYSGDGGLDGTFYLHGFKYYCQAKRYENFVNNKHIKEFTDACYRDKVRGIFVHTGRTPKAGGIESKLSTQGVDRDNSGRPLTGIRVLSGNKLFNFLNPH